MNADSQAINGYNGAGPFTIENNYLEAAGENVLFGGADPAVTNLVPSDIVLRRNHLFKPLEWRNAILAAPASPRATAGAAALSAAGTHYFRVVAVMATGTRTAHSAPSAEVSATVSSGGSGRRCRGRRSQARTSIGSIAAPAAGSQSKYLETTAIELDVHRHRRSRGRRRPRAAPSGWSRTPSS